MANGIKILDVKNESPVATVISSTTVIGLVGTALSTDIDEKVQALLDDSSQSNLLYFSDAEDALEVFKTQKGTIREDLWDIKMQNVKSPIIISLVAISDAQKDKDPFTFYDDEGIKSSIVLAVGNLQLARTLFNAKVRIAIAGYFSHDETVRNAIESLIVGTKIIGIADLALKKVSDSLVALKDLGSKRCLTFPINKKSWSVFEDKTIYKNCSAVVAGHIAYWDALLGEFGVCFDHANRPIQNVEGLEIPLKYEEGEDTCDVNMIVNAGGALIINDDGQKLYNFETPSDDTRFNKLETMRFFDVINENLQKTLKRHNHRPTTEVLELAKADTEAFLLKAINAGAAVGAKAWWSKSNTPTEISAGRLYLDYNAGNNVGVRTIIVQSYATNDYYTTEIKN